MRLIHLANFNSTNIGNGALIFGTERVLQEDLGPGLEFLAEAWDDYTFELKKFDQDFVDLVNRKSDALLVGGAVSFNGRPYLKNAGFRLDLPLELLKKIEKPIIFYGISYKFWPGQKYYHLDKLKLALDYLLASPRVFFGVRNDGAKDWLESLVGYKSNQIIEIPDPAVYVPVKDSNHPELVAGKKNVIISLNNEDEVYRFGGEFRKRTWDILAPRLEEKKLIRWWKRLPGWDSRRKKFLGELAQAIKKLAQEWDLNLILCPHYFDDYTTMSEFLPFFSRGVDSIRILHQVMVSRGLLRVPQTPYFYDLYAKADLALSMRIHSMSPAIGLGTPVVPLVSQSRMSDFLEKASLSDIGVDIFGGDVVNQVYKLASAALADRVSAAQKLRTAAAAMRDETFSFNRKISAILAS